MKTVIVTGASGNLGQAVVKKFLSEGYYVIGTVIPNDHVGIDIKDKNFDTVVVDLVDEEGVKQFVSGVVKKSGTIDAAVLTAGGFAMGNISDTPAADISFQYKLNFETSYIVARQVFIEMISQGRGRIFMIGARAGLEMRNGKGMAGYAIAKSLIFRLAELMNEEAKGKDVVTTVVVPSTIDTPQNRNNIPAADFNNWVKPGVIADIIYTYCTPAFSAIREPVIKVYNNA